MEFYVKLVVDISVFFFLKCTNLFEKRSKHTCKELPCFDKVG